MVEWFGGEHLKLTKAVNDATGKLELVALLSPH